MEKDKIRNFINSLQQLDNIGAQLQKIDAPEPRCYAEMLILDWFRIFYPGYQPTKEAMEFVVDVLMAQHDTTISPDWMPYIQSQIEWLGMATRDPQINKLNIFLFGYCWRMLSEERSDESE